MPHFVMDCSESVLKTHGEELILEQVFLVASATNLFDDNDIKVRINPFKKYSVGNKREEFIHVFASIMQGRTEEQKAALSQAVVSKLVEMFPEVPNIAMNVDDFEKATYCNRTML
ncbi:5-carboxymethyl-2-hydroxymuconate Delta-isomerase [Pseudoalteromonas luteoviolacea]|uniref:5-carboxymethyl-2-hydroxymuconate Delta-isomerase n=1 Tax=Pseudoalteromonas luteoviolacea TaxID=43657 RepID=UPI001F222EB7|nr:5-carboxymethyl-2-hydroxymuconate Delta-isomerase [Pseudoalteromonas luteoviolacea]MCF6441875.1 5-carboxymethyl-2-hydroxymuconate Delta-isomerase [Pseudoalteromonas luteoviolacea]